MNGMNQRTGFAIIARPTVGPEYVADTFKRESTADAVASERYGPRTSVVDLSKIDPATLNWRKPDSADFFEGLDLRGGAYLEGPAKALRDLVTLGWAIKKDGAHVITSAGRDALPDPVRVVWMALEDSEREAVMSARPFGGHALFSHRRTIDDLAARGVVEIACTDQKGVGYNLTAAGRTLAAFGSRQKPVA